MDRWGSGECRGDRGGGLELHVLDEAMRARSRRRAALVRRSPPSQARGLDLGQPDPVALVPLEQTQAADSGSSTTSVKMRESR